MVKPRQTSDDRQLRLFEAEVVIPGGSGEAGSVAGPSAESVLPSASRPEDTPSAALMERICDGDNLIRAMTKVRSNRGSCGVDGMKVSELEAWYLAHGEELREQLLSGRYQPQSVRGVKIPKPGGGERQLGIPTVIDRVVQQAFLQALEPILDPQFSDSSFGFRPGRSAHQALAQAQKYVAEGRIYVVDLDLEKFFDRVNHDVLMSRLSRHVRDKRVLRVIGRFLRAGMMQDGVCIERDEGTPQGGPLSPLLANLLLDDLDKELEQRGHCFCRYADDCNIYVWSEKAGERVMASVTRFLEEGLKLRVNRLKSAVAPVWERKFLGHRLLAEGRLGIAPKSIERFKARVVELTTRNRGISLGRMVTEVSRFLTGWVTYYRNAECSSILDRLDGWIRRRLRCFRLKQCKRAFAMAEFLRKQGVSEQKAWMLAGSGKGWWRKSNTPQASKAMGNAWFRDIGLVNLKSRHAGLNQWKKPPDTVSTSGGVGGRGP